MRGPLRNTWGCRANSRRERCRCGEHVHQRGEILAGEFRVIRTTRLEVALLAARKGHREVHAGTSPRPWRRSRSGPRATSCSTRSIPSAPPTTRAATRCSGCSCRAATRCTAWRIVPRGMALGATYQLPTDDRTSYAEDYLRAPTRAVSCSRQGRGVASPPRGAASRGPSQRDASQRTTPRLPGEIAQSSLTTLREKDGPTYRPRLHVAGEAAAVHARAGRLDPARPGVVSRGRDRRRVRGRRPLRSEGAQRGRAARAARVARRARRDARADGARRRAALAAHRPRRRSRPASRRSAHASPRWPREPGVSDRARPGAPPRRRAAAGVARDPAFTDDDVRLFAGSRTRRRLFGEAPVAPAAARVGSSLARIAEAAVSLFLVNVEGPMRQQARQGGDARGAARTCRPSSAAGRVILQGSSGRTWRPRSAASGAPGSARSVDTAT